MMSTILVHLAALVVCLAVVTDAIGLPTQNTNFAFNLYRKLTEKTDGNLFYSPVSVSIAMAMISEGCNAETANQVNEVMGFVDLDGELKTEVQELLNNFNDESNNYTLSK